MEILNRLFNMNEDTAANGAIAAVNESSAVTATVGSNVAYDDEELSNKMEGVPDVNHATLKKLQLNDPSVTSARALWAHGGYINTVNWREVPPNLGSNITHLKKFKLEILERGMGDDEGGYHMRGAVKENYEAFCRGLATNRSIEQLHIKNCTCMDTLLGALTPFLVHNPNLTQLVMERCRSENGVDRWNSILNAGTAQVMISALNNRVNKNSLRRLELFDSNLGTQQSAELINSLNQCNNLVRLCLGGNHIGLLGCQALGRLLSNINSQLYTLHLEYADINDECIRVFANVMASFNRLKSLSLSGNGDITPNGWETLARVLSHPNSLEALYMSESSLENRGAAAFATALVNNATLKILDLSYSDSVDCAGWQTFFGRLSHNVLVLEELSISENKINDAAAVDLSNALGNQGIVRSLKKLKLGDNLSIGATGWQALSNRFHSLNTTLVELDLSTNNVRDAEAIFITTALMNSPSLRSLNLRSNMIRTEGWGTFSTLFPTLQLEKLDIGYNSVSDEAASFLATALADMPTLKTFKMHYVGDITAVGLAAVSTVLDHPDAEIEHIDIGWNRNNDSVAIAYASKLTGTSKKLKSIDLDGDGTRITAAGWQAFSQAVWNKSSIMDTYTSNHTLQKLGMLRPADLVLPLKLNTNSDKKAVARQKIILAHFHGSDINVHVFHEMNTGLWPHAFAWAGRDGTGRSLAYMLVRTMPTLVEHISPMAASGKRKRETE